LAREERILLEQEVADHRLAEEIPLGELAQLLDALEQEEELRGQRMPPALAVVALEEGIGGRVLEHRARAVGVDEPARERRLAGADRALDDDVAKALEGRGRGRRRRKAGGIGHARNSSSDRIG